MGFDWKLKGKIPRQLIMNYVTDKGEKILDGNGEKEL
jgi:hypothetical protein